MMEPYLVNLLGRAILAIFEGSEFEVFVVPLFFLLSCVFVIWVSRTVIVWWRTRFFSKLNGISKGFAGMTVFVIVATILFPVFALANPMLDAPWLAVMFFTIVGHRVLRKKYASREVISLKRED